ncbi:hypothetical protein KC19_7G136300 [Ceratodon purpureus]|uniref:DUF7869 domain-containing protein n=1 Tax=Ceratodon purpureus TaxID=3225 RepID=A0A8T0HBB3_CERPU|nr:hypothetical protein KC19_7G136300 [Ceratodon purpureus]
MILWEAADLRPFGEVEDDDINAVGCPPTDVEEDVEPVQEFLDLAEQMEVALLEESGGSKRCVAAGVIMECSPKGTWEGFLIPHSFFLIVRVSSVNPEFSETPAFCELPNVLTIGCAVGRLVLWSGYKVCPLVNGAWAGTYPVGCPPTEPHLGNDNEEIDESNSAPSEQDLGTRAPMNISSDDDVSKQGESDVDTNDHCWGPDSGTSGTPSTPDASYLDPNLWRNRYVELLNHDLSVRGRAMIQVCLSDEACDDEVLGDTEVGVLFVSEDDHLQMTTLRWSLTHTRLEGGHLLSDIITYCSENLADADDGLDGVPKNAYRLVKRKVREKDDVSSAKLRQMVVPAECRLARREMSFVVQGHLRTVPGKRKLYVTLANVDVCEVAWYIIHGVSKSAYYSYKASARSGRVSGSHGNSGNADQMPNEFRMIGKKRVAALKVLPSAMNSNHVREMANAVNEQCNAKPISQSSVNRMRKEYFRNVEVKAVGSNFSKCTECDFLVELIAKYPRGSDEWQSLTEDRTRHLNYQRACRNIYYGWTTQSIQSPNEFLCIIHDKMDTSKTAIPRMQRITKATAGLGQIPISCTGMLTHGDPNFTISSLCRVFRALERLPVRESKALFEAPPQNEFFEALMHGSSRCIPSIPLSRDEPLTPPLPGRLAVPLPKKLYLQLDNSAKDNKNRFLLAFCSLLTARRIFKEVTVGFLIVGHTHEDIDAHFSHLSKLIKRKNTYCLANLMKAFMDSQKTVVFIPEVVQEVADFKSYVADFHHDGGNAIEGHSEMHLFKFYVVEDGEDAGWPVMRYKKRATDPSWLPPGKPEDHLPIWMGRAIEPVITEPGPNYGKFKVEWWTPMKGKKEGKKKVARECWTRQWERELTLAEWVECKSVVYTHRTKKTTHEGPPKSHLIPEEVVIAAMANFKSHGISMNWNDEEED